MTTGRPPTVQSRIVNALRQARGGYLTHAELIDAVWGDDPEGGPDNAALQINITVRLLRRRGFRIECIKGRGYRYVWTIWEVIDELSPKAGATPKRLET